MYSFLIPLARGVLLVAAILGVGKLALRLLKLRTLPWYWHLAFVAILGQAAINLIVQLFLISGLSTEPRLKILGWILLAAGLLGHLLNANPSAFRSAALQLRTDKFLKALLVAAWLINLAVALAPSSKIDELQYHMLVPKRIAADGTLHYYRLPIEAAIVPQMQYQISLSPAYALGAPESGNVLSLSYSIVLALFVIGFIRDRTANESLALLAGLGCAVGAYATVWHTTEGPAAIGELALVLAFCGFLWPDSLGADMQPVKAAFLVVTALSLAATTKISLLPLCAIISLLAAWKLYRSAKGVTQSLREVGTTLSPWAVMHFPLMLWTFHKSGSFWGPVLANVFRPSIFPASMLVILDKMRIVNQVGLLNNLRYASVELCPLLFVGLLFTLWNALRGRREELLIIGFLCFQALLVLWKLPYDFRFLGGLFYLPLIAAALRLPRSADQSAEPSSASALATRLVAARNWIALVGAVPWLAFQVYYARPFAETTLGLMTRSAFRARYVALAQDYDVLNRTLPADAVLYVANGRVSLFDAPRPVVLTMLDLRRQGPIYRLTLKDLPEKEPFDAASTLNCSQVVYVNDHAIFETYRLPGTKPKFAKLTVQRCQIEPARQAMSVATPSGVR